MKSYYGRKRVTVLSCLGRTDYTPFSMVDHVHAIEPELHPTVDESYGNALETIKKGGVSIEHTKSNIWHSYE